MKLYVGNLSFNTTENDLEDLFNQFGTVSEVALMTDHATGRSRGFAFVTMGSAEGTAAIEATNGKQVAGRSLTVNEARPREDRGPRGGGGGGGGGGGRGGDRDDRKSYSNYRR